MGAASYVQSSFLGGLVSKWTQGRYHDQHYRSWLETCLNGFPVETESWVRRPGFGLAGTTRQGLPGRCIKFDFQASAPYTMEFTNGHLRFWQSNQLATTNDSVAVSSISTANPAVAALASAVTWSTGDEGFFSGLGTTCPLLQNRRFTLTKVDTTHFSLADSITGATIDGSTLGVGSLAATATLNRVLDIATVYGSGLWSTLRSVQTEQTAFLLHPQFPPYELIVNSNPSPPVFATFSLAQSIFQDGPYLDPFTNGAQVVPNQKTGIVELTLQFPTYDATVSYAKGAFVTSSSVNYESLVDQNIGNTPVSSPSDWVAVSSGAAINNGQGFTVTDIGRLVRLFSEPALWLVGSTYSQGNVVAYNPTGLPGGSTYWQSLTNTNTGHIPGADATNWELVAPGAALPSIGNAAQTQAQAAGPAQWTWGKIVSLVTLVPNAPAGIAHVGNMTDNGGLAAAFDGNTSQNATASAASNTHSPNSFVGQNFSGCTPSSYAISSATVFPSTDQGIAWVTAVNAATQATVRATTTVTISLYGSNSPPASYNNGTLLGSVTLPPVDTFVYGFNGTVNTAIGTSAVTIQSSNTSTAYAYLWIAITAVQSENGFAFANLYFQTRAAEVQFVQAGTATSSNGVNVELLGPPLLYTTAILTWRLGLYSNTTGWPNVGTYAEGRLWLASAAFPNRIDACVADGIAGATNSQPAGTVNFAPTDQWGNVTEANAIDYTFNAPDANPILWMIPDLSGVLCGTKAGEWIVQAPSSGGISPLNIVARRMTVIGCANIEPRRTEHTIIFVQRYLRKIVEYFADVFSGKFTAPNLSKDAKQLTIGNIQEIAYQQELAPIVWARVNNGLIGTTYKRDTLMTSSGPTINGWHQHTLGSGRQVESLVVGSSVNGTLDALTLVTNDVSNVRFVEVLSPILDEGTLLSAAQYLDAAIAPSSTSAVAISNPNFPYGGLQLNGLWPLNGKTVTAWLGGLDLGDYTVANGSIQIAYGDGIAAGAGAFPASSGANRNDQGLFTAAFVSTGVTANGVTMWTGTMPMLVGFTYASQGRIVRPSAPAESGARSGPGFAKKRRSQWIMAQFEGSQGVSWGTQFDSTLQTVRFTQANGQAYTVDQQFSGIVRDNPQADYDFDNMLCWQVTRPYICNVQAIGAALETQDI